MTFEEVLAATHQSGPGGQPEAMYVIVNKRSPGTAINEHFAKCDRLKVPHIVVHRGTTRSDVEWDCITLDPERHEHILSDRQLAETILCILDRFRGQRVTLLGGRWYGILRGIPVALAEGVAGEIWQAYMVSMNRLLSPGRSVDQIEGRAP